MCHHNPDDIHTSFQPLQKLISLISTPSTKVEELIIEIMSYSVWWLCVLHHTYCTLYGICSCSVVLMYNSLILPQYLSHTATGVMKIEVYTAVSETPYFCLMVQLCVCIFEYVCLWVCVYLYMGVFMCLFILLYVCHGSNKAAEKNADKAKAKKQDRD